MRANHAIIILEKVLAKNYVNLCCLPILSMILTFGNFIKMVYGTSFVSTSNLWIYGAESLCFCKTKL